MPVTDREEPDREEPARPSEPASEPLVDMCVGFPSPVVHPSEPLMDAPKKAALARKKESPSKEQGGVQSPGAQGKKVKTETADAYASASGGPKKAAAGDRGRPIWTSHRTASDESPARVRTKGAKGEPPKEASKEVAETVDEEEGGSSGGSKAVLDQPEGAAENPRGSKPKDSATLHALRDKESQRKSIDMARNLRDLTAISPFGSTPVPGGGSSRSRPGIRERERGAASASPTEGEQGVDGGTTLPKVRRPTFQGKRPAWELRLGGKLPTPTKDGLMSGGVGNAAHRRPAAGGAGGARARVSGVRGGGGGKVKDHKHHKRGKRGSVSFADEEVRHPSNLNP